jgi:uridine kinase/ribulose-5-phosphate 4-epimerase/fuculose-1-phosphate aldolase
MAEATAEKGRQVGNNPFFIGIAGESGVGKSTIANVISLFLGNYDTLRISTDDLHKWERTSRNWDKFTHLNPAANNLELGDIQVTDLANNKPIYRSVYNHSTGAFDPPTRMEAKKYIINEGLHAFYTQAMEEIIDLKVFVDTDDDLRTHWKLIRDTEQRGYKYNSVIEAINKRRSDGVLVRERQIKIADAIVRLGTANKIKFLGSKNEDIILTVDFEYKNDEARANPMFGFIQQFMLGLNDFARTSSIVGNNVELCQNNGGNVSVKVSDSIMIIKASGYEMKDIHGLNGHSVVNHDDVRSNFSSGNVVDDWSLVKAVNDAVPLAEYKRPSMETGFHAHLGKYVVHTHPIYLNVILCLDGSKDIIDEVFAGWEYVYVDYRNPGFDVCKGIAKNSGGNTYFLANHGLIVSLDNCKSAIKRSIDVNSMSKEYLRRRCPNFEEFSLGFADMAMDPGFFYPDSAVFLDDDAMQKREILAAHNYISKVGRSIGKLRYLTHENVSFLRNLESERYRKSL